MNIKRLIWMFSGCVAFFSLAWLVFFVPSTMDEFLPYHRLACWSHSYSQLNTFREGCNLHCNDFFGFKYHRSFAYVGVTSSLIYYPFFKLFPQIMSHYILGIIFLIIIALLFSKSLDIPYRISLIPILYPPLTMAITHDTGPVRLALLTYPVIAICVSRLVSVRYCWVNKLFWICFSTCLILLALEDKPFYAYLFPSILLLSFAISMYNNKGISPNNFENKNLFKKFQTLFLNKSSIISLGIFGILILIGCDLIFFRIKAGDSSLLPYLVSVSQTLKKYTVIEELKMMVAYLFCPIVYLKWIFTFNTFNSRTIISFISFSPILAILFFNIMKSNKHYIDAFLSSLLLLVIIFCLSGATVNPHHFIFLHLPLITLLMIFASESDKNAERILISLSVCSILTFFLLCGLANRAQYQSRDAILDYLSTNNATRNSVINFSSWDGYYIQSLYGPSKQLVTFISPLNDLSFKDINILLKRKNSQTFFNVCRDCTIDDMKYFFKTQNVNEIENKMNIWKIFKISY